MRLATFLPPGQTTPRAEAVHGTDAVRAAVMGLYQGSDGRVSLDCSNAVTRRLTAVKLASLTTQQYEVQTTARSAKATRPLAVGASAA